MRCDATAVFSDDTLALNYPHNGGQVPILAQQTLLTSAVASFPNPPVTEEEAEPSVTPESIFVPFSNVPESDRKNEVNPPTGHGSKDSEKFEDGDTGMDGRDLETLLDLWMIAKIREASTALSSSISNLKRKKFLPDIPMSSIFTVSRERWDYAPARIHSWVTRKSCAWLGVCDMSRRQNDFLPFGYHNENQLDQNVPQGPWTEEKSGGKLGDGRVLGEIPDYVLEHAPYVHLFSKERYWPSDIAVHLDHITPKLNYTPILPSSEHPTLTDLDDLNQWEKGLNVYLTSNDDVETNPPWLESKMNIPQPLPGDDQNKIPRTETRTPERNGDYPHGLHKEDEGDAPCSDSDLEPNEEESTSGRPGSRPLRRKPGKSDAPAVLIVVDKGEGIVDAFWFYFYSFNQGNEVLNIEFGNHVGDWEHTLVRFENGQPKTVFCSEHSFGEAFTYDAAEKIGKRPVVYSATGSHAMYSSPGVHAYILPFGLLHDETDRGPLWDPALNNLAYTYDYQDDLLLASTSNPQAPISWFYFAGKWGDKIYPLSDKRQYTFAGQYHYVNGPLGPRFKNLGRKNVCQGDDEPCLVKKIIGGDTKSYRWNGVGEGEEMSDEDYQRFFRKNPTSEIPPYLEN